MIIIYLIKLFIESNATQLTICIDQKTLISSSINKSLHVNTLLKKEGGL